MDETGAEKDEVTEEKSEDVCKEHTDDECNEHTEKSKKVASLDDTEKKGNVTSIFDRTAEKKTEIKDKDCVSKSNELGISGVKPSYRKNQQVI